MSQIHVHDDEPVDATGDRTGAAAFNLITVVIVLAVLGVIAWYLSTGPLRVGAGTSQTNINVNPAPAPTSVNINVNPAPAQPNAPTNPNPPTNSNPGGTAPNNNPPPTKP